jgi:membrane protein DedA with SNARE-associated domain
MLASLSDTIRAEIGADGYPALVVLVCVENLFPPIPSEVILPLAGFYVGEGLLAFVPAVAAATLGSLAGALALYALGRFGGRPLVLRYGRLLRVDEPRLARAEGWFDRHGDAVVLLGRMVPGARSIVSIPAGLTEMPVLRFSLLTAVGSTVWNAALIGAGMALGDNWEQASEIVGQASKLGLAALAATAIALAALWAWRRYARPSLGGRDNDGADE